MSDLLKMFQQNGISYFFGAKFLDSGPASVFYITNNNTSVVIPNHVKNMIVQYGKFLSYLCVGYACSQTIWPSFQSHLTRNARPTAFVVHSQSELVVRCRRRLPTFYSLTLLFLPDRVRSLSCALILSYGDLVRRTVLSKTHSMMMYFSLANILLSYSSAFNFLLLRLCRTRTMPPLVWFRWYIWIFAELNSDIRLRTILSTCILRSYSNYFYFFPRSASFYSIH